MEQHTHDPVSAAPIYSQSSGFQVVQPTVITRTQDAPAHKTHLPSLWTQNRETLLLKISTIRTPWFWSHFFWAKMCILHVGNTVLVVFQERLSVSEDKKTGFSQRKVLMNYYRVKFCKPEHFANGNHGKLKSRLRSFCAWRDQAKKR